ncbi:hypothetical protein SCHPADRAFT_996326 [Schizopora paradoxa]|uniref:Uncharacterized protein n=1 Tax=Schizopora paradoxa TaxID=27342 RepID=A0A0H2SCX8_9AGAM|nr:hypothetical protein SCHPADRAFT_996326 [Schizopora paradoxa]
MSPPPAGFRVPLNLNSSFPPHEQALDPPCKDGEGNAVYFGSALFLTAVIPCKITPNENRPCSVPYGGKELKHRGRFDLLPFTQNMELVPTTNGRIPPGRMAVEGGYEGSERQYTLYHGVAKHEHGGTVVLVPGKVGKHLGTGGCIYTFENVEYFAENYDVLCWKESSLFVELRPATFQL